MCTHGHQSVHDTSLYRLALEYRRLGYRVRADAAGYEKPDCIHGYRPDLVATRLLYGPPTVVQTVIVEVETEDSAHTYDAIARADAFWQAAAEDPNTRFLIWMAPARRPGPATWL